MVRARSDGWLAAAAVLMSAGFLLGFGPLITPDSDALQHQTLGWNLAQGRGFSLSTTAPFTPSMYREPFYPAWLALVYRFSGHRPDLVAWLQIAWFAATCLLVAMLSRRLVDKRLAWGVGLVTACFPTLANYPNYLLTESVATCLLLAAVGAVCAWMDRPSARWAAAAGLLFGVLSLCKAVMVPLVLLMALGALLVRSAVPFRRRVLQGLVMVGCCAMIVGPWMWRNHQLFQSWKLSLRGELALWIRANKLEDSPRQLAQLAVYGFSEAAGVLIFPDAAAVSSDVVLRDAHLVNERQRVLMEQGLTQEAANRRIGEEAAQRILRHPLAYLLQTPLELLKLTAFSYVPALNEPRVVEAAGRRPFGRVLLSMSRAMTRSLAYPLLVLAGYGLWMRRRQWRQWWPLAAAVGYVNGIHAMLFGYGRYAVPLIPLYVILAGMGVAAWRDARAGAPRRPVAS